MQKYGIDYSETFAPVVRYDTLRVFLALVAERNLELTQFDVKTAFLYGELNESVYMELPKGLRSSSKENSVVCKLVKSLYGLKQAPRCWNQKFSAFLSKFNLSASGADKCMFHGRMNDIDVYLALFVDDGMIASSSCKVNNTIIEHLKKTFEITIADGRQFVGLQIERNRAMGTLFIHQTAYTKQLIKRYGMTDGKGMRVPAEPKTVLMPNECECDRITNKPYREAVGSLMFLAIVSRPDIVYAVNEVSRFLENHNNAHWQAVTRIIRYLINTVDFGITYRSGGSNSELVGFADADFARDIENRKSTTGYAFMLSNGIVTWKSRRQKHVALSTTEAEYVAASTAAREGIWLRKLLMDYGQSGEKPTVIHMDNQSAICLTKKPNIAQTYKTH